MSRHRTYFLCQPERLQAYLDGLTRVAGHANRVVPIENYTNGLMLPMERKSVEPMAARLAPGKVRQMHQSLVSHRDLARRYRRQYAFPLCPPAPGAWPIEITGAVSHIQSMAAARTGGQAGSVRLSSADGDAEARGLGSKCQAHLPSILHLLNRCIVARPGRVGGALHPGARTEWADCLLLARRVGGHPLRSGSLRWRVGT